MEEALFEIIKQLKVANSLKALELAKENNLIEVSSLKEKLDSILDLLV